MHDTFNSLRILYVLCVSAVSGKSRHTRNIANAV